MLWSHLQSATRVQLLWSLCLFTKGSGQPPQQARHPHEDKATIPNIYSRPLGAGRCSKQLPCIILFHLPTAYERLNHSPQFWKRTFSLSQLIFVDIICLHRRVVKSWGFVVRWLGVESRVTVTSFVISSKLLSLRPSFLVFKMGILKSSSQRCCKREAR